MAKNSPGWFAALFSPDLDVRGDSESQTRSILSAKGDVNVFFQDKLTQAFTLMESAVC
jgi:hypothetical protein